MAFFFFLVMFFFLMFSTILYKNDTIILLKTIQLYKGLVATLILAVHMQLEQDLVSRLMQFRYNCNSCPALMTSSVHKGTELCF